MKPRGNRQSVASPGRPTLLLVDDEPSVRELVGRALKEEGYVVFTAADGVEAIAVADANAISLVILDLHMPRKGGWDTFEQLSRNHPLMPIIVVTARPNQLFTAVGAGVGALLEKPFEIPILVQNIERLIRESNEARLARLVGQESAFHYAAAKS